MSSLFPINVEVHHAYVKYTSVRNSINYLPIFSRESGTSSRLFHAERRRGRSRVLLPSSSDILLKRSYSWTARCSRTTGPTRALACLPSVICSDFRASSCQDPHLKPDFVYSEKMKRRLQTPNYITSCCLCSTLRIHKIDERGGCDGNHQYGNFKMRGRGR